MTGPITSELVRRAERRGYCTDTVNTLAVLGTAVDAGLIELGDLLDLARSCATADQLGDALTMLAATMPAEPDEFDCFLLALPAALATTEVPTWTR